MRNDLNGEVGMRNAECGIKEKIFTTEGHGTTRKMKYN